MPTDSLSILRRSGFTQRQCDDIAARAHALRVSPEEVAIAWNLISAEDFYRVLARELAIPFIATPFVVDRRAVSPHSVEAGATCDRSGRVVLAPQGDMLRRFMAAPPENCALTSPDNLRISLRAAYRCDAAWVAATELALLSPHASARREGDASGFVIVAWLIALVAIAFGAPRFSWPVTLPLALLFAVAIGLRLVAIALWRHAGETQTQPVLPLGELPFYSILIPLYGEDRIIPRLVGAMEALDYPPEKLEVLFLIEDDDAITRAALARMRLQPFMRIVSCPPGIPRTKPRALNIGLHESRGRYVAVFDAEDSPEADQLRKAAAAFRIASDDVACLQAELTIENGASTWLTRCFALEYAALFQIIVRGLCALDLPVALGGTSNHFRRDVILAIGGWDAWNVTEDADLGLRLAINGYRVAALASRTWEEAPQTWRDWRQQRMRWVKGWMQTALVHMRAVRRIRHRVPFRVRVGLWHHLIAVPVAALLTPLFSIALIAMAIVPSDDPIVLCILTAGAALAMAAIATTLALYVHARPALSTPARWQAICTSPLYSVAISLCAWLALIELVRHPFRWNKTPHGASVPIVINGLPRRKPWPSHSASPEKRRKASGASPDAYAPPRSQTPPRL